MKDKVAIVVVLFVIIIVTIYSSYRKKNLLDNLVYTESKIIEFKYLGKTDYSVNYVFFVKNKKYIGKVSTSFFKCSNETKGCVGKKFKVGYSFKDPSINEIDLGSYNKFKTSVNSIFK
jgi:hypothetical protein